MKLDQSVVRPFVAETMRALWLVIAVLFFAACCAPYAFATPHEVRYRHPGGSIAYDAVQVCEGDDCEVYARECAPGATCTVTADLASGEHTAVWLIAAAGERRSDPSNRRSFSVPAPEGCAWDSDGSGWVTPLDFGAFLRRFGAGEVNLTDFAAFLRVFGRPCA